MSPADRTSKTTADAPGAVPGKGHAEATARTRCAARGATEKEPARARTQRPFEAARKQPREDDWMTRLDPIRLPGTPRVHHSPLGGREVERPAAGCCRGRPDGTPQEQQKPIGGGQGRPPAPAHRAPDQGRSRTQVNRPDGGSNGISRPMDGPDGQTMNSAAESMHPASTTPRGTKTAPIGHPLPPHSRDRLETESRPPAHRSASSPPSDRHAAPCGGPAGEQMQMQSRARLVPPGIEEHGPGSPSAHASEEAQRARRHSRFTIAPPRERARGGRSTKRIELKRQRPWDRALDPGVPAWCSRIGITPDAVDSTASGSPHSGRGSGANRGSDADPTEQTLSSGPTMAQRRPESARWDTPSSGPVLLRPPIYPAGADGQAFGFDSNPPQSDFLPVGAARRANGEVSDWTETTAHRPAGRTGDIVGPFGRFDESPGRLVSPPDAPRSLAFAALGAPMPARHRPGDPSSGAMVLPAWTRSTADLALDERRPPRADTGRHIRWLSGPSASPPRVHSWVGDPNRSGPSLSFETAQHDAPPTRFSVETPPVPRREASQPVSCRERRAHNWQGAREVPPEIPSVHRVETGGSPTLERPNAQPSPPDDGHSRRRCDGPPSSRLRVNEGRSGPTGVMSETTVEPAPEAHAKGERGTIPRGSTPVPRPDAEGLPSSGQHPPWPRMHAAVGPKPPGVHRTLQLGAMTDIAPQRLGQGSPQQASRADEQAIYLPGERLFHLPGKRVDVRRRSQPAGRVDHDSRDCSVREGCPPTRRQNRSPQVLGMRGGWSGLGRQRAGWTHSSPSQRMTGTPIPSPSRGPTPDRKFSGRCASPGDGGLPPRRFDSGCSMTRAIARRCPPGARRLHTPQGSVHRRTMAYTPPVKGWSHRLAAPIGASQRCDIQEVNTI